MTPQRWPLYPGKWSGLSCPLCFTYYLADFIHVFILLHSIFKQKRCDYVMKAPYVTHALHFYRGCVSTPDDARRHMNSVSANLHGTGPSTCYVIPYMILQERAICNAEVKMVFLNKQFSHTVSGLNLRHSLQGYSRDELIEFGYQVLDELGNHPQFILDGLIRVDIFSDKARGRLVVNEVEGYEASYAGSAINESNVTHFLELYWENKIYESVTSLYRRMNRIIAGEY